MGLQRTFVQIVPQVCDGRAVGVGIDEYFGVEHYKSNVASNVLVCAR